LGNKGTLGRKDGLEKKRRGGGGGKQTPQAWHPIQVIHSNIMVFSVICYYIDGSKLGTKFIIYGCMIKDHN
jgi:hypothetical protein